MTKLNQGALVALAVLTFWDVSGGSLAHVALEPHTHAEVYAPFAATRRLAVTFVTSATSSSPVGTWVMWPGS